MVALRQTARYKPDPTVERVIQENYDGQTATITRLAERFHMTRQQIKRIASKLGVTQQRHDRPWTAHECDVLERYIASRSWRELARMLARSERSVQQKAWSLGLRKRDCEGYTASDLCAILGVSERRLSEWCADVHLTPRRRLSARSAAQGGDYTHYSREDVRRLILAHPLEFRRIRLQDPAVWVWFLDIMAGGAA